LRDGLNLAVVARTERKARRVELDLPARLHVDLSRFIESSIVDERDLDRKRLAGLDAVDRPASRGVRRFLPALGLRGIEFSQIEFRRSRVPFMARLIDLESQPGARDIQIRGFGYFEDGAIVQYDPPATASFYVSQENPVLGRGVIMQWVTLPERGSL
jgi:hypothetical protein